MTKPRDQRLRRDRRATEPPPMVLTPRDRAIVRTVHAYRLLSQEQLQRLFFSGRSATQRVLQRLYQHGYLDRRFLTVLQGRGSTLYVLDRRGVELLRSQEGFDTVDRYAATDLKTEFLAHLVAMNDVRIAVTLGAERTGYELVRWIDERVLKADFDRVRITGEWGRGEALPLIPDGYFTLKTPRGYANCFLELDMGTMTSARFKKKVQSYITYYRSGGFEQRFRAKAMRVLVVASSAKRLENLRVATEAAGGQKAFWFAIASDLTPEAVLSQPVWQVATETAKVKLIEPL